MNASSPRLTDGWYQLRDFYHLEGDCLFMFNYVGFSIDDREGREVVYSSFGDPASRVGGYLQGVHEEPSSMELDHPEIHIISDDSEGEDFNDNEIDDSGVGASVEGDSDFDEDVVDGPDIPEIVAGNGGGLQANNVGMNQAANGDFEYFFTQVLTYDQATGDFMVKIWILIEFIYLSVLYLSVYFG